jgi:hypothetical protein
LNSSNTALKVDYLNQIRLIINPPLYRPEHNLFGFILTLTAGGKGLYCVGLKLAIALETLVQTDKLHSLQYSLVLIPKVFILKT